MEKWLLTVETRTENYLTKRKIRKKLRKEKLKKRNPILDWVLAILEAAFWVLLLNQYLLQAYQIPSGSMEKTLLINDRIFVNKLIFGPELLPGVGKLKGFREPVRGDVITFENPTYISKGPAFDLVQRILYMITFSLVDIDKDELGNPRVHFLIKRASGVGGDRLKFNNGELYIKPPGFSDWVTEKELLAASGKSDFTVRLLRNENYPSIKNSAYSEVFNQAGLTIASLKNIPVSRQSASQDLYAWAHWRNEAYYSLMPFDRRYGANWWKGELGWYLPPNWVFPLGDNRDNSRDARYFGPVEVKKVLGKGSFKYWPLGRIGIIR